MFQDANDIRTTTWTTDDNADHRVTFPRVPGSRDAPDEFDPKGKHCATFAYARLPGSVSSQEHVTSEGLVPKHRLDHGLTISSYRSDPEKHFVDLRNDRFDDRVASADTMRRSPGPRSNPIGTFFDPDRVLRAHGEGGSPDGSRPAKLLLDPIVMMVLPVASAGTTEPVP